MMKCTQESEQATKRSTSPKTQKKGPVHARKIGRTYGKTCKKPRNSFLVRNICATEEVVGREPADTVLYTKKGRY